MKVFIRCISIQNVGDAGSVNIGSTLNLINKETGRSDQRGDGTSPGDTQPIQPTPRVVIPPPDASV